MPNLLYRWRKLILEDSSVAVTGDDNVASNGEVREMETCQISASRTVAYGASAAHDIRHNMLEAAEIRFAAAQTISTVEMLSDYRSAYTARDTRICVNS